jgi:hypothetical protein
VVAAFDEVGGIWEESDTGPVSHVGAVRFLKLLKRVLSSLRAFLSLLTRQDGSSKIAETQRPGY